MRLNPELQRYTWLEFSLQRVIVMPLVMGIIFYIAYQGKYPEEQVIATASFLFFLLIGLWGGNKAATAVIEEVNDNTWDFQRLSSVSPSSLALGKIFGSTLYCWYGGMFALTAYVFMATLVMPVHDVFFNALLMVCSGLICHSAALFSSIQAIQVKPSGRGKIQAIGAHIIGLGLASLFTSGIVSVLQYKYKLKITNTINWYGYDYIYNEFTAFFAVITLLWLIGGVYWQMRGQLRMRTGPWLWIAFTIYTMIVIAGFNVNPRFYKGLDSGLLVSFLVGVAFLYVMAFLEPWNGLVYKRLLDSWNAKNIKNFMHLFPRWIATLIITSLLLIVVVLNYINVPNTFSIAIAIMCFIVRDIALLHYFKLHPESRRATSATLFYLLVLYVLIPVFLGAVGAADSVSLFFPVPIKGQIVVSILSASMQAALFVFLALGRWKKYWQ
jgi:hypothetical protein